MTQILLALNYMHKKRMVHRDIKPENILLEKEDALTIKLCDFGFSIIMAPDENSISEFVGTPYYVAPEVINGDPYDSKCDVWSVGVLAYELLTGQPCFLGMTKNEILNSILFDEPEFKGNSDLMSLSEMVWGELTELSKKFIRAALEKDFKSRPTVAELLDHPWIAKFGMKSPRRLHEID